MADSFKKITYQINIMFYTIKEIKNAMKIHGRFLQKKNKDSKIETFEISNIYREGIDLKIIIELDNGRSGYFDINQIYKNFEFLDETPFSNVKVYEDIIKTDTKDFLGCL